MVIMHNMEAMNASRQVNIGNNKKAKSTERLSSGYRINRAADDAAGLTISEKCAGRSEDLTGHRIIQRRAFRIFGRQTGL